MPRLPLLLAILLLTACAGRPPAPPGGDGAVLFRLSMSATGRGASPLGGVGIVLQRLAPVPGPGPVLRPQLDSDFLGSYRYGAALPPGRYALVQLLLAGGNVRLAPGTLGSFDIAPGRLTYLGNLMALTAAPEAVGDLPVPAAALPDGNRLYLAHAGTEADGTEGRALAQRHFGVLAWMGRAPLQGWRRDSYDAAAMAALHRRLRGYGGGHFGLLDLGDEGVLFGSERGLILRVVPGQAPQWLDVGAPYAVLALARLPDGDLLAGGEDGFLAVSRDHGRHWTRVATSLPPGAIRALAVAADGTLYALHLGPEKYRGRVRVYKGRLGRELWSSVLDEDYPTNLVPSLVRQGTAVLAATHDHHLTAFAPDSVTAETRLLPGYTRSVVATPDGGLVADSVDGVGQGLFASGDGGRHWQRLPAAVPLVKPVFADARHGLAVTASQGGQPLYFETADGGASWTEVPVARPAEPLGYTRDGRLLFLQDEAGRLFYSPDNGRRLFPAAPGSE